MNKNIFLSISIIFMVQLCFTQKLFIEKDTLNLKKILISQNREKINDTCFIDTVIKFSIYNQLDSDIHFFNCALGVLSSNCDNLNDSNNHDYFFILRKLDSAHSCVDVNFKSLDGDCGMVKRIPELNIQIKKYSTYSCKILHNTYWNKEQLNKGYSVEMWVKIKVNGKERFLKSNKLIFYRHI